LRKFFKRIGKGIKKAFRKIGKFIGKMGIIGQIGMMMFLPMVGGFLMKGLGNVAGSLLASNAGIIRGVGHVLKGAHSFVQGGINAFRTVSEGVTSFVSQFTKTAASKLGFNVTDAAPNFFGKGGAWERVQSGIVQNAKSIFDPFRSNITITQGMQDSLTGDKTNIDIVSRNTGISKDMLTRLNPDSAFKVGDVINVDMGTLQPIPNGEIVTGLDNISPKTQKEIDFYDKQIAANRERLITPKTPIDIPEMPVGPDGKPIPGFSKEMGFKSEAFVKDPNALNMPLNPDGSPVAGFDKNMGFDQTVKVKPRSIIADQPIEIKAKTVEAASAEVPVQYEEVGYGAGGTEYRKITTDPKEKGIVGGFVSDFKGAPLRTASTAYTAYQTLAGQGEYPDYGGYTGVVESPPAPLVQGGGYNDPQFFTGDPMGQYYQNMAHGTASLFETSDAWNDWSRRYTAGGQSAYYN